MSIVSLCMIVKNEADHLPGCLESVRALVDEIVVVDTGSTDQTVEIAESFGAEVYRFAWKDDFSAARNESLRHAAGDWVAFLDADERLNCMGEPDCLRKAASDPRIDAYLVPIKNYRKGSNAVDPQLAHAIRFFRRYPDIHFVGKVHERVDVFLEKQGAAISRSAFFIEHLGYDVEQSRMERKWRRNLALLRKQIEEDPEDAHSYYHLGLTLLALDREDESRRELDCALQYVGSNATLRAMILNMISYCYLKKHEYPQAIEAAGKSLKIVPWQNMARVMLGFGHYFQRNYQLALPLLLEAYEFFNLPPEKRQTAVHYEDTIERSDHLKAIAMSYAETGQYARAISFFHRLIDECGGDPDSIRCLGICYLNTQDFHAAVHHLKEAEKLGVHRSLLSKPLAYALARIGRSGEAGQYSSTSPVQ